MDLFRRLVKTPFNWGHSHPKDEVIGKVLEQIMEPKPHDALAQSIISHLVTCKPCAGTTCGLLNQARSAKHFAA